MRSSGCILCVLCGGRVSSWIPCSRAYRTAAKVLWLWWPSSTIICCTSLEAFVHFTKCCSHLMNKSASVHPLELAYPTDCGGAPVISVSTMRFLGKMNIGGIWEPVAFIAQMTVTVEPRSPLVILLTWRTPLVATIFPGLCTFVMPVSSIFHIRDGVKA